MRSFQPNGARVRLQNERAAESVIFQLDRQREINNDNAKGGGAFFMGDIDLVYLWVDGGDANFSRCRAARFKVWGVSRNANIAQQNGAERCRDNNELRYSLRSVEKYAPWVRKIFIVSDGQTPQWLNVAHSKIRMVPHGEIVPKRYLPTYNSNVLEACVPHIDGLSEQFLYANDDTFFGAPVSPDDFFDANGNPSVYVKYQFMRRHTLADAAAFRRAYAKKKLYGKAVLLARKLIYDRYAAHYPLIPSHNIEPLRKSYCLDTLQTFRADFDAMMQNSFRDVGDVSKFLYHLNDFCKGRTVLKLNVDRGRDIRLDANRLKTIWLWKWLNGWRRHRYNTIDGRRIFDKVLRERPKLFCVNDDYDAHPYAAQAFFDKMFPEKSAFER